VPSAVLADGAGMAADPAASTGSAGAPVATDDTPVAVFEEEVFATAEPPVIPTSNTIATKLPLPLVRTPASVGVVTETMIAQQGALVLGDALENVAGINVQTESGVADFFVVRGLDSVSSSLILTDGAPEPESSFYQLYNVERAEVLKGPSAFVYGGGPLGGTINLVRKQPEAPESYRVGLRYGSFGTAQGTVDADLGNAAGTLGLRINGLFRSSDGYRDSRDQEVTAVNPVLTWRPGERTSVHTSFEHLDLFYRPDSGLPLLFGATGPGVPDVPRERSYQSPLDRSEQDIDRAQVDVTSYLSDRLVVRNKTYFRSLDWNSTSTTFNGAFPTPQGTLVSRNLLTLDSDQEFLGDQAEALWTVRRGTVTHNLLVGLEVAQRDDRFGFVAALLPPLLLDDPQEPPVIQPFPVQQLGADARTVIIAPYAVDQIGIGSRVQLLLGGRFDDLRFDDKLLGIDRSDSQLSPMLGLVVAVADPLSFYANWTEAFAPPSTFALTTNRVPEESRQGEVGLKASLFQGRGRATVAAYEVDRRNLAIPDATGITRQTGDQRTRGFEAELVGRLPGGLEVTGGYAYTDAELTEFREVVPFGPGPADFVIVDRSGNTPPFTPEHLFHLWAFKRLPSGLGVGAKARYVSEQQIDEDNVFQVDGYTTLDLTGTYERGPWRLSLLLENITDEEYLTRGFTNTSVIPAPGVSASVGVDYRF
jgi:TonB-dependent siderophore receptor